MKFQAGLQHQDKYKHKTNNLVVALLQMEIDHENGGGLYHIQNVKNGNDLMDITFITQRITSTKIRELI